MGCGKLAIEQHGPGPAQRGDQPGERHFRGIALPAEHAFATEHAGKAHAIKAADQRALALRVHRPGLDRMSMAHGMQRAIAVADALRNPAILRPGARRGARIDHRIERRIAGHHKAPAPQRARQRMRAVEPVERQDRAQARLHPIDFRVVAAIGHGKDPGTIGPEQKIGRDDGTVGLQHDG
ncbi:hypothetical protein GCM10019060_33780 [Novosphingobium pokkalii]|nr:hypothetical protein GCM10019060_33780 [Novosphingobium pokkalii]